MHAIWRAVPCMHAIGRAVHACDRQYRVSYRDGGRQDWLRCEEGGRVAAGAHQPQPQPPTHAAQRSWHARVPRSAHAPVRAQQHQQEQQAVSMNAPMTVTTTRLIVARPLMPRTTCSPEVW